MPTAGFTGSARSFSSFSSFREFYPFHLTEHSDLACRRLHFVGTSLSLILTPSVI